MGGGSASVKRCIQGTDRLGHKIVDLRRSGYGSMSHCYMVLLLERCSRLTQGAPVTLLGRPHVSRARLGELQQLGPPEGAASRIGEAQEAKA